jgi:peroxiredoxin Q/BCP
MNKAIRLATFFILSILMLFINCVSGSDPVVVNEKAPLFCLTDQDNESTCIRDFRGKWVVLYFYPKDNSPVCTIQAIEYTRMLEEFNQLNAVVIGVSDDSIESHCDFIAEYDLKLILLSDMEQEVMKEYGSEGLLDRNTFLIDPEGIVVFKWLGVDAKDDPQNVLNKIIELGEK